MSEAKEEVRQIQPVVPQRVGLAEAVKRHHVVTIQGTAEHTEDYLDPAYWALVARNFTVGDTIEVRDDAMTYWGEYLVVACEATWAKVEKLREKKLASNKAADEKLASGYEIAFKGPHLRYCVIRTSDKEIVQQKLQTRDAAEDWVRDHLKAMRRAA